jgi:RNase P/RNase MRP subunit POP5
VSLELIRSKAINRGELGEKIRAKVEHVFGDWIMTMVGKLVRSIGLDAVSAMLGLKHLTYNLKRFVYHQAQITA